MVLHGPGRGATRRQRSCNNLEMIGWYRRNILPKRLAAEMSSPELEEIRKEALSHASGVVLEIGSGPGYNIPLYKNVSKLYALEPMKELRDMAALQSTQAPFPVEFLAVGAEQVPLESRSVDTVVSTWSLCSVSDLPRVLSEIARVLRPGGRFVFVEHGASPHRVIRAAQSFFTLMTRHFTGNCHFDRFIAKEISKAGFTIETGKEYPEQGRPLIYNYEGVATAADATPAVRL